MKKSNVINTVGTRKKSVARAALKDGKGVVRINRKPLEQVRPEIARMKIEEPLIISGDACKKYDISVNVTGGGFISQSEAARLAIAKAIVEKNAKLKDDFLKYDRTLLVADVRQRETRKPNRGGKARAKIQKSYR